MACYQLQLFTANLAALSPRDIAFNDYFSADDTREAHEFARGWAAICPSAIGYKLLHPDGHTIALIDIRSEDGHAAGDTRVL